MYYDEVELLAPAGKWSVMEKVVQAGADAVYLGGKRLNMRMLRKEFNFSPQELIGAAQYLHERNKKIYITINNLYYDSEIDEIREYLNFLQEIEVDSLIVQDMAIVQMCHEMKLQIPLHASVQMGIGSSAAARFLEAQGFSRAILSKNLSLDEIRSINKDSSLFLEFFAHGDLCIAHTGQCYMSSFMKAASSNRGLCIKPCRWRYSMEADKTSCGESSYYLSHNDLCLYPHIKELLDAGVRSFKIEGRMRDADYVAHLIHIYRQELDRVMANPDKPSFDANEFQKLYDNRIRDFTSGNLFTRTGMESIGSTGEREPFFPSSTFILKKLEAEDYNYTNKLAAAGQRTNCMPMLSVKAGSLDSLKQLDKSAIDTIIIGCEQIINNKNVWELDSIADALVSVNDGKAEILLETPRIVTENDLNSIMELNQLVKINRLSGFIVNDYGSIEILKASGLKICGGPGLNVTNSLAARLLLQNGLSRLTASLELEWPQLKELLCSGNDIELMVQGPRCGIVTDFCLPRAISEDNESVCLSPCLKADYSLCDEYGQKYTIRTDQKCRNYVYYPFDLCLFAGLPILAAAGLNHIRIDGQYYDYDTLQQTVDIYLEACQQIGRGKWTQAENFNTLLNIFPQGLTSTPVFLINKDI
ncbi:MAG: U32 family peptidase [Syntrophomonadaceae bacterium]|nr:U32 family peptidase [Syntrophomonadaceae bacterium]